jgi:hypothetical protein
MEMDDTITPNISLSFLYGVHLDLLLRETIQNMYAPGVTKRSLMEMEITISNLNTEADRWLAGLPVEFHFTKLGSTATDPFACQRADLGFRFYNTKILISQSCFRHLCDQTSGVSPGGSFCDKMAVICVQMACRMLDMLPSEPDTSWLYKVCPWWCVLHYIMQSTTVLLIELFARTIPGTIKAISLVQKIQKSTQWLQEMSTKDPSSRQAWLVCMDILSQHGEKFALKIDRSL